MQAIIVFYVGLVEEDYKVIYNNFASPNSPRQILVAIDAISVGCDILNIITIV